MSWISPTAGPQGTDTHTHTHTPMYLQVKARLYLTPHLAGPLPYLSQVTACPQ